MVFAHLAVIWKARLPNNKLYNYLQGYDNLCSFCGRILQRYFPPEDEGKPDIFILAEFSRIYLSSHLGIDFLMRLNMLI